MSPAHAMKHSERDRPAGGGTGRRPSTGFWLLASCIYLTLIYSTALHLGMGPERTVNLTFFQATPGEGNIDLTDHYPDQGRWRDPDGEPVRWKDAFLANFFGLDAWKLSSGWPDAGCYLLQCESLEESIAPYKYRIVPTFVVGTIAKVLNVPIPPVFALFNAMVIFVTACLFTVYLNRDFGLASLPSLIGGMLFIALPANTSTAAFPMLEPVSMLFTMLIFLAVARGLAGLFVVSVVLGVLTKEVLAVGLLLWFLNNVDPDARTWRPWARALLPCALPVAAFVVVRLALEGGALEVNYGYNLLRGEMPTQYLERLLHPIPLVLLFMKLFLAFGFLWVGLGWVRSHPFPRGSILYVVLVTIACIALSSRIVRPMGILFPIVIPAFLLLLTRCDRDPRRTGRADIGGQRGGVHEAGGEVIA